MRRWVLWAPLLTLALLALLARPFSAQPEIDACIIAGRVTNEDGTPVPGATVSVRSAMRALAFIADQNGFYTGEADAGPVTVTVGRAVVQATLTMGMTTRVDIALVQTGWTLALTYPDGTPAAALLAALYYRTADGREGQVMPDAPTPGLLTFVGVPPNARTVAVVARNAAPGRGQRPFARQWTYTDDAPKRALTMTIERPGAVTIKVTDDAGAPVAGLMTVSLEADMLDTTTSASLLQPGPWKTRVTPVIANARQIAGPDGVQFLGVLAPATYRVTLRSATTTGATVEFTVRDNTPTEVAYTLAARKRAVTQTVFGYDGKPLADTPVMATFVRGNTAIVQQARTDARGLVTWADLPSRSLVWSDAAPTVMLPDRDTIVDPLPPVAAAGRVVLRFALAPDAPRLPHGTKLAWRYYGRTTGMVEGEATFLGRASDSIEVAGFLANATPGEPFALVGATAGTPLATVAVLNGRIPLVEDGASQLTYPLTHAVGVVSTVRFAAGVSRVQVSPAVAPASAAPASTLRRMWREVGLLQPTDNQDGSFAVRLPAPGRYTVFPDLFDLRDATPEGFTIDAAADGERQVVLPTPLFSVPAGADVSWLARATAGASQTLTMGASAPTMPVYGPRDAILAAWYKPSPRELVIWRPDAPEQRLALRPAALQPLLKGAPFVGQLGLLPLLPVSREDVGRFLPAPRQPSERVGLLFDMTTEPLARADLWNGQYLFSTVTKPRAKPARPMAEEYRAVVAIPDAGGPVVAMFSPALPADKAVTHALTVQFPAEAYARLGVTAAGSLRLTFDTGDNVTLTAEQLGARTAYNPAIGYRIPAYMYGHPTAPAVAIAVPDGARTMTVRWPGMGVIADVALPPEKTLAAPLALPAWQPGCTVAGVIVQPDGRPAASVALVGEQSGADGPARIAAVTGADGRFTIKGLAPGPLGLAIDTARGAGTVGYSRIAYPSGGWSLDVPAAGVADVALKATTNPVVFALGKTTPDATLWWLPDGERPRAVLRLGFVFASYDLPVRPGWVWGHPGDARGAWCARLTPVPGTNTLTMDGDSPALGLTLPFDVTAQPGAVTLVGQVAREGFQVTIAAPVWQPSPQLGLYVASIDAVPPGCYTVRVATARGAVEATAVVTEHGGFVALVP